MEHRALAVAFSLSFGVHLALLLLQVLAADWLRLPKPRGPLDVVYQVEQADRELARLQEQLARAKRESAAVAGAPGLSERAQIRIPERPALVTDQVLSEAMALRSSVVDLGDLVEASGGDPVLLSYFSLIRERIQETANQQRWLEEQVAQGIMFVSFVLEASGSVHGLGVVPGRSSGPPALQSAAVAIVRTSAPFPPFPPSIKDPQKTIVVPLEFLIGP